MNIVGEVQCLDFRLPPSRWLTWRKLIFSQLLFVGQPGSKYEFEKRRSKGGNPFSSVSSSAPPPGYEWMGNWSRSRSIGWGGLLADMARGGRGSRNIEEIPNVWSNKYWKKMEEIQHNVWNKYWRNKEEIQHYQGLIADIARGVGDQEIWKKYKMFDQTNTGKNMKKYNIIEGQGQGSRNMEIPNVESNKCWGLKAQ